MKAVVVDTDVISYIFKADTRGQPYINYLGQTTNFYSFQTLAELRFWALHHHWSENRWLKMLAHLDNYNLIEHNAAITENWAVVMHLSQLAGRRILAADAWVAATALELGIPLVTHNKKDFLGVAGLEIISFAEV